MLYTLVTATVCRLSCFSVYVVTDSGCAWHWSKLFETISACSADYWVFAGKFLSLLPTYYDITRFVKFF